MPKKGIFLVVTCPTSAEQEAAYNKWYDETHTRDTLLLPGFIKARRFKRAKEQLIPPKAAAPDFDYVAIYEVEDVDKIPEARALMPKLVEISAEFMSPAIDTDKTRAFIYEQIAEIDEPTPLPEGVEFGAGS